MMGYLSNPLGSSISTVGDAVAIGPVYEGQFWLGYSQRRADETIQSRRAGGR